MKRKEAVARIKSNKKLPKEHLIKKLMRMTSEEACAYGYVFRLEFTEDIEKE